nr:hypothetical protein [Clostridiales bacterium]
MKRNNIKKAVGIFLILVAFAIFWSFAAFSQTVKYNLLDAKLFPSPYAVEDQTVIGVLFTKEDGVLYFGTFWTSETYGDAWEEEKVGNYDYKTGYATLATHWGDKYEMERVYVAFTTDDGKIAYLYRSNVGGSWYGLTYIESMNVGGNGTVYNPDIDFYYGSDREEAYISYMDTNGADYYDPNDPHEDKYHYPDVMLAKLETGDYGVKSVEKTVVEAGGGFNYFSEKAGKQIKYEIIPSNAQAAVKDGNINVVYETVVHDYNIAHDENPHFINFFSDVSNESMAAGKGAEITPLFDVCASGDNLFTLVHGSLDSLSSLYVLNGQEIISQSYISGIGHNGVNAADITANLMQSGEFSYAAICWYDTLCYYDSASNKSVYAFLNTKIDSENKKVVVVETNNEEDDARYVLYTGENGKIVVVRLSDSDVSDGIPSTEGREYFIPAEENTKYDLYVGGKQVDEKNASDVLE